LAVAPEISISDITIKNVVFLIMEDSDLSFPKIEYFPNGAIGFPVTRTFGELHFDKSNIIFIPQNPL